MLHLHTYLSRLVILGECDFLRLHLFMRAFEI